MTVVPIYEAKTRLSELLARAQQGEVITITRHGAPAGRLVAAETAESAAEGQAQHQRVDAAFEALRILREGVTLDLPLREAIEQGRD